jgi:nudix-type nucleoside diphosphatase (YffH/AdpP family)
MIDQVMRLIRSHTLRLDNSSAQAARPQRRQCIALNAREKVFCMGWLEHIVGIPARCRNGLSSILPSLTGPLMTDHRRVEIRKERRLLDDFFKIDEVIVAHQRYDGGMSGDERRLVFERGDAVAVLLFDGSAQTVVLVEQFRLPALIARRRDNPESTDGWITELVAGMIDEGETPEQAIVRETFEETGYRIRDPQLIGKFFSSPGGTSERFFLHFARISKAHREGRGGGLAGEEDIKVRYVAIDDLFDRLARGTIEDSKLAIAGFWLKDDIGRL